MGQNPIVAVTAALVLIGAVIFTIKNLVSSEGPPTTYSNWYDLDKDELYGSDEHAVAPITSPSGGEAVKAKVFANGSCDIKEDRFIGYLEKYTDEAKRDMDEAIEKGSIDMMRMGMISAAGRMIKRLEDDDWVMGASAEGRAILYEFSGPANVDPKPCLFFLK